MVEQTGEHALEHSLPAGAWSTAQLCARRAALMAASRSVQPGLNCNHSCSFLPGPGLWESLWPLLQPPVNKQGDKSGEVEYVSDMRLKVQKDLVESLGGCPGGLWGKGTLQSPEAALRPWVTLPPASLLVCNV